MVVALRYVRKNFRTGVSFRDSYDYLNCVVEVWKTFSLKWMLRFSFYSIARLIHRLAISDVISL